MGLDKAKPFHLTVFGKKYVVSFQAVAVTAAQDFFEIIAAANMTVFLDKVVIQQSTEFGDAAAEQLRISIKRGAGNTVGSGGNAAVTAPPLMSGEDAAASVCDTVHTTAAVAGGGSLTVLLEEDVPVDRGLTYEAPRDGRFSFRPTESLIVSIDEAPDDSITFSGYLIFEEVGSSKLIDVFA